MSGAAMGPGDMNYVDINELVRQEKEKYPPIVEVVKDQTKGDLVAFLNERGIEAKKGKNGEIFIKKGWTGAALDFLASTLSLRSAAAAERPSEGVGYLGTDRNEVQIALKSLESSLEDGRRYTFKRDRLFKMYVNPDKLPESDLLKIVADYNRMNQAKNEAGIPMDAVVRGRLLMALILNYHGKFSGALGFLTGSPEKGSDLGSDISSMFPDLTQSLGRKAEEAGDVDVVALLKASLEKSEKKTEEMRQKLQKLIQTKKEYDDYVKAKKCNEYADYLNKFLFDKSLTVNDEVLAKVNEAESYIINNIEYAGTGEVDNIPLIKAVANEIRKRYKK